MMENEARAIANELASEIGLPVPRGAILVHARSDGGYQLWVSADPEWLSQHRLPGEFKGLTVLPTERIVCYAHRRAAAYS
jgi:hypothetical protein